MMNTQKCTEVIVVERQRTVSVAVRVKANKGAPGIDGMTIEEVLPCLLQHQQELTTRIYRGKFTPSPSKTS